MNSRDVNKIEMYKTTQSALDDNSSTWVGSMAALTRMKIVLDANIITLGKLAGKLGGSSKGITRSKNMLKKIVAEKAEIVAGCIAAYASDKELITLEENVDISADKLKKMKDEEMPLAVDNLITIANKNEADTVDYGVNVDMITELSTSLDDLNEQMGKPRVYTVNKSASRESFNSLMDETDILLKKRIDKMMKRYKYTNPQFHSVYFRARIIVDN